MAGSSILEMLRLDTRTSRSYFEDLLPSEIYILLLLPTIAGLNGDDAVLGMR